MNGHAVPGLAVRRSEFRDRACPGGDRRDRRRVLLGRPNPLHRLEGFASHFMADFYGLPRTTTRVRLRRRSWRVPEALQAAGDSLVPLFAGRELPWQLSD